MIFHNDKKLISQERRANTNIHASNNSFKEQEAKYERTEKREENSQLQVEISPLLYQKLVKEINRKWKGYQRPDQFYHSDLPNWYL